MVLLRWWLVRTPFIVFGYQLLLRDRSFCRSYSGYSKVGFDRRFRVYDISDYGEVIRTWKRTERLEVRDSMTLYGADAPPPFEG